MLDGEPRAGGPYRCKTTDFFGNGHTKIADSALSHFMPSWRLNLVLHFLRYHRGIDEAPPTMLEWTGVLPRPLDRGLGHVRGRVFFMRTLVLIDGQNLYHLARRAWPSESASPYAWPSYDVEKLAHLLVSRTPGRTLAEIRFYTGVPNPAVGPSEMFWHGFWSNKIRYRGAEGSTSIGAE